MLTYWLGLKIGLVDICTLQILNVLTKAHIGKLFIPQMIQVDQPLDVGFIQMEWFMLNGIMVEHQHLMSMI